MGRPSADQPWTPIIEEISAIDRIEAIERAYVERHGRAPSNLSHWDPLPQFVENVSRRLARIWNDDAVRYKFSYQLANRTMLLRRLGYHCRQRRIIVTENGTSAALCAANTLSLLGTKRVVLLAPCYFAARHALRRMGIEVVIRHWVRRDGEFSFPRLDLQPGDAVWVENPIFNTGCVGAQLWESLTALEAMGHRIVVDECLSIPPTACPPALAESPLYFAIHAPHKAISVNGMKFGAVTFDAEHYSIFDQWLDILNGGLSISSRHAIEHFLSEEFAADSDVVHAAIRAGENTFHEATKQLDPTAQLDRATQGYWRTVYFPDLNSQLGEDDHWLASIVEGAGAIFIPGSRAAFDPKWGFCFRVNLLRLDARHRGALRRLLRHLAPSHGSRRSL